MNSYRASLPMNARIEERSVGDVALGFEAAALDP